MALRRTIRMRKEYLYRKSLEGKDREEYEKKLKVREALQDGKRLPTELVDEGAELRNQINLEDSRTEKPINTIDDEYASAGSRDPKVCVTTSRDPSSRLKQFAKEVKLIIPNAQRINRGNYKVGDLVETCRNNDFTDMVFVQETRGEPDGLVVCHLPLGPTAYFSLTNVVLRHDIEGRGTISEQYPHLILHQFTTPVGHRISDVLKHLFPVPKPEATRCITLANQDDYVSFRHHTFQKPPGAGPKKPAQVELTEVGPRFEMRPYQLKLGTIDQLDAENEWVLKPYMNTAKKRKLL